MSSVTEYLSQLQTLTKKNLEILQAINEAFFTKQNHLQVAVGDSNYVIPSFISLENKINILEENQNKKNLKIPLMLVRKFIMYVFVY